MRMVVNIIKSFSGKALKKVFFLYFKISFKPIFSQYDDLVKGTLLLKQIDALE